MDATKRDLISIAVAAVAAVVVLLGASPSGDQATACIERAQRILSDPVRAEAETCNAVSAVLDAAVALAAGSRVDPKVHAKLVQAQELVARRSPSLERAATLVNESHALLHAGASFTMPKELRTRPEIVEQMRARLSESRRLIDKGDAERAVTVLVEVLAMVFTPVDAR